MRARCCHRSLGLAVAVGALAACRSTAPSDAAANRIERIVRAAIEPTLAEHRIPGMAVGVIVDGEPHVFTFGVAAKASGEPVTADTLFEIGSVSKTFTATLVGYAQATGALALTDRASQHLPELAGSAFDRVSLLDLGTYTAGGLPLQVPDGIADDRQLFAFLRTWQPPLAIGSQRLYSNPSIGLCGEAAARALHAPFAEVMTTTLLPRLGLQHTYLHVPQDQLANYAWGHTADDAPIRVAPGPLDAQTYGIVTNVVDLLAFVALQLAPPPDSVLQRAIAATHTGYHSVAAMTQGLGWQMYADPRDLDALLAGNSAQLLFEANTITRCDPPRPPDDSMLFDKTGSTNGFGAYVAFVPSQRLGIVLLANKNWPIAARVRAAHRILMALAPKAG